MWVQRGWRPRSSSTAEGVLKAQKYAVTGPHLGPELRPGDLRGVCSLWCSPFSSHPSSLWEWEGCRDPGVLSGLCSGIWTHMLCFPSPWNVPAQEPCRLHPAPTPTSSQIPPLFIVNKPWVKSDPGWNPGMTATSLLCPPAPGLQMCCSVWTPLGQGCSHTTADPKARVSARGAEMSLRWPRPPPVSSQGTSWASSHPQGRQGSPCALTCSFTSSLLPPQALRGSPCGEGHEQAPNPELLPS